MTKRDPFKYFHSSPEVIRLAVMLYVRFPLSLRNVEDLLHERGIDISHETVRYWWNRFGPMFAAEIRRKRVRQMRAYSNWQWHLDEVFVKINGETHYLWRAVDHEGEVLESYVTKRRNRKAALKFLRKTMKRHGHPQILVTDKLRSYGAAMKVMAVSPRGLRAHRSRPASRRQRSDLVTLAHIKEQSRLSLGSYGRPRMTEELKEIGLNVGHRRVGRLMRQNGISVEMAIFGYINGFYNPRRRHSALGWKSPVAFERKVA